MPIPAISDAKFKPKNKKQPYDKDRALLKKGKTFDEYLEAIRAKRVAVEKG